MTGIDSHTKMNLLSNLIELHEQYLSNMCSLYDFKVSPEKIFCDNIFRECNI